MNHRFKHPFFWMTAVLMILLLPLSAWAVNTPKTVVAKVQKSDASIPAGADITIVATDASDETATYANGTDPKGIISYDPSNGGITFAVNNFAAQWQAGDTFSIVIQVGSPGDPGFEFGSTSTTLTADFFQTFSTDANLDIQLQASLRNMTVSAGNNQTGTVDTVLSTAIEITVTDDYGDAVAGVTPTASGDGTLSFSATGSDGKTTGSWTLGTTAGAQTITVSLNGYPNAVVSATASAATASTLTVTGITDPVTAGTASDVVVTAYDAHGNVATGYTGTIALTSSDMQAVLPANYTFLAGDNGTKTFAAGITLKTAGEQTVTATDTVTGSITATQSAITVNPATASTLTVTGITDPVTAGTSSDVVVTAYDAYSNIATGYTGTVTFTSSDGQAVLPADYTFVGGDSGTKTISGVVLKTANEQTVTATDTVTGSITGTQSAITVNPAAADAITVTGISDPVTAGTSSDVVVTAYDEFNNIATGYTGTITFTSSDGQAVLPEDYTFQASDNGTKTFTAGITLKTVNDQTVTATDTVTGSITATQSAITVSPAAAVTLTVTGITDPVTAGTASDVIVTAYDSFGNIATGYTGTIAFTSSDTNAVLPGNYTFVGGDSGTKTFAASVTLKTAGEQTVTATDTSAGTVTGTQSAITVNAAAAAKLSLSATRTTLASDQKGNATLTAQLLDAFDNAVASQGVSITLAVSDSTYVTLDSTSLTTDAAGSATATITTKAGTIANPPQTTTVTATSGALTQDSVTFTLVNFSILTDAPGAPYYSQLAGVGLVTSSATPYTATFSGAGSTTGDYRWALTGVGSISSTTADAVTYTAPATITGSSQTGTLTLTSASDGTLSDSITITVYNPVTVTDPAGAIGIAVGDSYTVTASGGTGTYTFTSSNAGVASLSGQTATSAVVTGVATGTVTVSAKDSTFADAVTNGFNTVTPAIEVVTPITINGPLNLSLQSGDTFTFDANGGKTDGEVTWEASAGTIDAATGAYTAPTVAQGSSQVTITAYDKTYGKTHATPVKTEYTLTVYATVQIEDKPATEPTVISGSSLTLTVAGGDDAVYNWTVSGPVAVAGGTGTSFTFTAPTTGAFAGVYTVWVVDNKGFDDHIDIKVPMALSPASYVLLENAGPQTLTLTGAPIGTTYTVTQLDTAKVALADTATGYGAFDNGDGNSPVEHFTYTPDDIDAITSFYVKFEADDPTLIADGLDSVTSGIYRVIPVKAYAGFIVDEGNVGIGGVTVQVTAPDQWAASAVTSNLGDADDGKFSFTLPDTGAVYSFMATMTGYVDKTFDSVGWNLTDASANKVLLTEIAPGAYISGTVTVPGGVTDVQVTAIYENAAGTLTKAGITAMNPGGTFTIGLAEDPGADAYTLTASAAGYYTETAAAGSLPLTGVSLDLSDPTSALADTSTLSTLAGGSTPLTTVAGQSVSVVEIPFGSLDTTAVTSIAISVALTTNEDTSLTLASGTNLYEITVTNTADASEITTFIQPIILTLPFDLSVVGPGQFENGTYVIYHAPTRADLLNGLNVAAVSPSDIVSVDYVGDGAYGLVTFKVSSLSVFGIGAASSSGVTLGDTSSDSRCFIATAAYGSPFEKHVSILRQFRDVFLMPTKLGHAFVQTYYTYSPKAAAFIADHDSLRAMVRVALLPAVGISYMMLHFGLIVTLAMFAGVAALMTFAGFRIRRARLN